LEINSSPAFISRGTKTLKTGSRPKNFFFAPKNRKQTEKFLFCFKKPRADRKISFSLQKTPSTPKKFFFASKNSKHFKKILFRFKKLQALRKISFSLQKTPSTPKNFFFASKSAEPDAARKRP